MVRKLHDFIYRKIMGKRLEKINKMNIQDLVESPINKLWKEHDNESYCAFSPISVDEIPSEGLVFIGLNPSLPEKEKERLIVKNDKQCEFYSLNKESQQDYKYFKKFKDISEKTNLEWGHIDLLYCRETNQGNVEKIYNTERGLDFIYQQLMISKTVIDKIIDEKKPRIFVVNNTLSREFLGNYHSQQPENKSTNWMGYDFVWNEKYGTYVYKNNPFFLTSMLTGQRALDNGSYERLIWQINRVKNILK
ncbi:MAG: hypothetical protein ACI8YQ_004608 [Polaribacter sp.]|jgi:hypothetical protein